MEVHHLGELDDHEHVLVLCVRCHAATRRQVG
jgi:hypothetical protein